MGCKQSKGAYEKVPASEKADLQPPAYPRQTNIFIYEGIAVPRSGTLVMTAAACSDTDVKVKVVDTESGRTLVNTSMCVESPRDWVAGFTAAVSRFYASQSE